MNKLAPAPIASLSAAAHAARAAERAKSKEAPLTPRGVWRARCEPASPSTLTQAGGLTTHNPEHKW
jgi:hypothetical protein